MKNRIAKLVDFLDRSTDIQKAAQAVKFHVENLGFENFVYALTSSQQATDTPTFVTTFTPEWMSYYREKNFQSVDVVLRHSVHANLPFTWENVRNRQTLLGLQRELFHEAAKIGIQSGGVIPIHGANDTRGMLSVSHSCNDEHFRKMFAEHRFELQLLAAYVHETAVSLQPKNTAIRTSRLTPRQREILLWAALGKSRWEIGEILGISEQTVKKHMAGACAQLLASNTTHAVSIAIRAGLITI